MTKNTETQAPRIQFKDLIEMTSSYNGEEITVRGFLYHTSDGMSILSAEPNLKSCCIGSDAKRSQQIVISGSNLPKKNNLAVSLKGKLFSEKDHFGYRMSNAETVDKNAHEWPIATLSIFAVGAIFLILLFRRRRNC